MSLLNRLLWFGIWVAFVAPLPAGAEQPVELRIRLEPGQTFKRCMQIDTHSIRKVQGEKQESTTTLRVDHKHEVLHKNEDGSYRVRVTYIGTAIKEQGNADGVDYDSTRDRKSAKPLPPKARFHDALVGESFEYTVTPTGRVRGVTGAEDLLEDLLARIDLPSGNAGTAVERQIRLAFSPGTIRDRLDLLTAAYPGRPVQERGTWSVQAELAGPVPTTLVDRYTLEQRKDGWVFLSVQSEVDTNEQEPVRFDEVTVRYDLTGEQSRALLVDERTGLSLRLTMKHELAGDVHVSLPNHELKHPTSIENTITVTPLGDDAVTNAGDGSD